MEVFLAIVILFFALWGIADCLRAISMRALVPKNMRQRFIVPVKDMQGYFDLLSELELIRWRNDKGAVVLLVDIGMDAETRLLCEKEAEENPIIVLCKPEEVVHIIQ